MINKIKILTDKQKRVATALAFRDPDETIKDIASCFGITDRTIRRWYEIQEFKEKIEKVRKDERPLTISEVLKRLTPNDLENLAKLLKDNSNMDIESNLDISKELKTIEDRCESYWNDKKKKGFSNLNQREERINNAYHEISRTSRVVLALITGMDPDRIMTWDEIEQEMQELRMMEEDFCGLDK